MKFEKLYTIKKGEWMAWRETLADAIDDFYEVYSMYPNILEASDHTLSQFDFLVNIMPDERQHVQKKDDVTGTISMPGKSETILLSGFDSIYTDIDFAIDNQLADKEFRLVYDDEAEWDEPYKPEDCPEEELETILETM
jgi:hypothetical protein